MTLLEFMEIVVNRLRDSEKNHYGFFDQRGGLQVQTPGGAVCFSQSQILSADITQQGGSIETLTPGVYWVSYLVNIPPESLVHTNFYLSVDGIALPGSHVSVDAEGPGSHTFAGQGIYLTKTAAVLQLCSQASIEFKAHEEEVSASLQLMRLTGLPSNDQNLGG